MPGAAIDLLKRTAQRAAGREAARVERADVLDVLSQLTGIPPLVLDDRERLDLAALRAFFAARVIGQDEALGAVVDRIAMLKAGLIDPGKPIGVFLFAGPTGTGKTELAKTLAEFLFGSSERLIRLDMSEFQTAESTKKIVGDTDQHADVQSLAHRVRKQPFSVLLLDEFEKAHPNTWDLFLQVFDDGRLTDATGVTADFRHCIIILTSNLGAKIPQGLGVGFGSTAGAFSQEQVIKAVHQTFRPEFVNRLDAVIVFRPLSRELMRGILTKELKGVLERRGLRDREWAVEWESSALDFLLEKGFSPTMGARPLKRAIDRHLLAPLAATLVEHRFPQGDQFLFVRSDGRAIEVEFVDPDAPGDPATEVPETVLPARVTLPRMIVQPAGTEEERSSLGADLRRLEAMAGDEQWTATEAGIAQDMQHPGFWDRPDRFRILSRYALMDRVKAAIDTAKGLETRLVRSATNGRSSKDLVSRLASQLYVIEHGIQDISSESPVEVVLAVQPVLDASDDPSTSAAWCERLLEMYRRWAARRHMQIDEVTGAASCTSLAVISGFGAARILARETGLHVLEYAAPAEEPARAVARVRVAATPDDAPDEGPLRQHVLITALDQAPASAAVVRRYRLDTSPLVRDVASGWRTGRAELVMDGHFDLLADVLPRE
jgi:ATP-dependent Clp protease ATP-binding subunit ClpC